MSVADSAPATTITFPAAGSTLRGLAGFIATATDGGGVTKVEFYADGTL